MDHLSSEILGAYLSNSLSADERGEVERHLVSCAECRTEIIEAQRTLSTVPSAKRPNRSWYAVASLAAAAVIALVIWPRGEISRAPEPVERDAQVAVTAGSVAIVSPAADAELNGASPSFTWKRDDGSSYRITVTDEAGKSVWSATTQDTTIVLPASVSLARGGRFFWYVDALRPDGRSLTSGINSFHTAK